MSTKTMRSGGGLSNLIGFWNNQAEEKEVEKAVPKGVKIRSWDNIPKFSSSMEKCNNKLETRDVVSSKDTVVGMFSSSLNHDDCNESSSRLRGGRQSSEDHCGEHKTSDNKNSETRNKITRISDEKDYGTGKSGPNIPSYQKTPPVSPLVTNSSSCAANSPTSSSPSSPISPITNKTISPFARFRQLESSSNSGSSPGLSPSRGINLYRNASLPASPRPPSASPSPGAVAARSGSGAKEMILMWVQNRIKDYPIPMTNFSTCWNDGLAFCALIHVFYPDNFDWYALDANNRRHNFTLGFDKAEELADIYPLLEVDDMVKFKKPDWKCVFTYVQSFYRRFRDGRSPPRRIPPLSIESVGEKPVMSAVAQAVADSQEAEKRGRKIVVQAISCQSSQVNSKDVKSEQKATILNDKSEEKAIINNNKSEERENEKQDNSTKKSNNVANAPNLNENNANGSTKQKGVIETLKDLSKDNQIKHSETPRAKSSSPFLEETNHRSTKSKNWSSSRSKTVGDDTEHENKLNKDDTKITSVTHSVTLST